MPTIAQLNRQSELLRSAITNVVGFGGPAGTAESRAAEEDFLGFTRGVINASNRTAGQPGGRGSGQVVGAGADFDILPQTTSARGRSMVGQSGQITGSFNTTGISRTSQRALRSQGGGGGQGGSDFVSSSQSDIQPQLDPILSRILEEGGTAQARQASAQRQTATAAILASLTQLTPQAAEARASGAVDAIIRRSLDEALPQLQAAQEGAGASRDALSALQLNDIAARTAETASTVVIDAITQFAQAQAQLGSVAEQITETDPVSRELISLITSTPVQSRSGQGNLSALSELGIIDDEQLQNFLNQVQ